MNRPIKFRGYYDGEIYEVTEIFWSDGTASLYRSVDQEMRHVRLEEIILLEFTGLLDKKEKEIWEGDIYRKPDGTTARVYFDEGAFVSALWAKLGTPLAWFNDKRCHFNEEIEVIGNIYENPDLID